MCTRINVHECVSVRERERAHTIYKCLLTYMNIDLEFCFSFTHEICEVARKKMKY